METYKYTDFAGNVTYYIKTPNPSKLGRQLGLISANVEISGFIRATVNNNDFVIGSRIPDEVIEEVKECDDILGQA